MWVRWIHTQHKTKLHNATYLWWDHSENIIGNKDTIGTWSSQGATIWWTEIPTILKVEPRTVCWGVILCGGRFCFSLWNPTKLFSKQPSLISYSRFPIRLFYSLLHESLNGTVQFAAIRMEFILRNIYSQAAHYVNISMSTLSDHP